MVDHLGSNTFNATFWGRATEILLKPPTHEDSQTRQLLSAYSEYKV